MEQLRLLRHKTAGEQIILAKWRDSDGSEPGLHSVHSRNVPRGTKCRFSHIGTKIRGKFNPQCDARKSRRIMYASTKNPMPSAKGMIPRTEVSIASGSHRESSENVST